MTPALKHKPACITACDIEALARQGVERAVAARAAVTELTPEQAGEVGGGFSLLAGPIIYGGLRDIVLARDGLDIGQMGDMQQMY
jgi:hypothetical protein